MTLMEKKREIIKMSKIKLSAKIWKARESCDISHVSSEF